MRKKYPPRRNLTSAARGCDEKSQGRIAEVKTPAASHVSKTARRWAPGIPYLTRYSDFTILPYTHDRCTVFKAGNLGRNEPQSLARVPRGCTGPHGLCAVRCPAWWQASGCEGAERLWRSGVVEIIKDHRGDTFRAVYTLRYAGWVYVLHAFQKKSKTGRETPRRDMELIKQRLREAEQIAKEMKP